MSAEAPPDTDTPSRAEKVISITRHLPFTTAVVGLMIVLGVVFQTLWSPLQDRALLESVAYGLPALQAGKVWTPITGAFFGLIPIQYIPVAGGAALLIGWSEWRLGTRKVAIAAISAHLVGVLGASLVLAILTASTSWDWAVRLGGVLDVGFSAGAFGAVAAASVTLSPPWRGRLRILLLLYAVISLLYIGLLWDVEHLFGILVGLIIGPFLVGRRPKLDGIRFSRHEWRVIAAGMFVALAVVRVVLYVTPSNGPLGASTDDTDAVGVLIDAGVSLALAWGLSKGRRLTWHLAGALSTLLLASDVLLLVIEVGAADQVNASGEVVSSVPDLIVSTGMWASQLTVLIVGRSAFRAKSKRKRRAILTADGSDRDTAIALLKAHGGSTMSWMGTWPENSWFIHRDTANEPLGYISFQVHRGMAIALGDPVATDVEARAAVTKAWRNQQETLGHKVCLFSVTDEVVNWGREMGWRDLLVAQEAIIDLPGLEFKGKSWQSVRTALNRAQKDGITYREGRLADMPRGLISQVRSISELWVSDKDLPEMGFTLGGVDEALDPETMVGLAVDADMTVHGVTSWMPVFAEDGQVRGWTLDVMRRLPDGFRPVIEFLIASACLAFRESGASFVSLSGAPLAHSGDGTADRAAIERVLDHLGEVLEPVYGFRSLDSFKQKFQPRHESVSMVFSDEAALPRIGLALTSAYLPDASIRDLAKAGFSTIKGNPT